MDQVISRHDLLVEYEKLLKAFRNHRTNTHKVNAQGCETCLISDEIMHHAQSILDQNKGKLEFIRFYTSMSIKKVDYDKLATTENLWYM